MWKAYIISVIAILKGLWIFIYGDGQSFYQVKSIIKKTQCFKNHIEYGSVGLLISDHFGPDLIWFNCHFGDLALEL